ncbi:uncharacterized protein [Epargyreus clarus]|uniref:uncharacterized protein n=1 Tax=Epargyreus clarus TaxID=520877 RepID=UPI003C2B1370
MLQEISRRTIDLIKYEDIDMVWHNNALTVRCESGLHIYDYSYNLRCLDKNVDLYESKVQPSKSSPASELLSQSVTKCRVKNIDLTQMILDPALWPHNKLMMDAAIITDCDWSPIDFIYNNECVIAVLNSAGNIDLYSHRRHEWVKLENLSLKLKSEMDLHSLIPPSFLNSPLDLIPVKKTVYALESSALCWAPELNKNKSCYFVTSQKNGLILFWLLKYKEKSMDVDLKHYITENTEEIITMKWIPTYENRFMLVCVNVTGQIIAYECQIENNNVKHLNTHILWAYKDKMVAQYIIYEFYNDHIILACNKHRHLLLQMIDKNCKVVLQNVTNVNDQRITSVLKGKNGIHVSTVNRELYSVKYVVENNVLEVHLNLVEIKGIPAVYEIYGCAFSTNDAFLAIALLDRTILCRKKPLKLEIILYAEMNQDLELQTIVNNPAKSLTDMWDMIELLKCKALKSRGLPAFDYDKLYKEAQTDSYYAKVYLNILILYDNLERIIQNGSKGILPEICIATVKSNILASHAVKIMNNLYESCIKENVDDRFSYECFLMAGHHLEEFCKKFKKKLSELLAPDIVNIFQNKKNSLNYTCQSCDEKLKGFVCKEGHLNIFCILTFTPIEANDYLFCRNCGVTVRHELYLEKPKCVFCDLYLSNCYVP